MLASVRGLGVAAKMGKAGLSRSRPPGTSVGIELEALVELPKTVAFWSKQGYVESGRNGNRLNMLKMLPITRVLVTAEDTRAYGELVGNPCSAAATW